MKLPFEMYITNEIELWRHDSFWTKEPETLEWISDFKEKAIFFDIGANIGIYSLYCAAIHPDSLIFAFEPVRCNYARLIQNIALNGFNNIIALPIGMSGVTRLDKMYEISQETGHSGSLINQLPIEKVTKEYMVPTITIDDFARMWGIIPDHIKIDTDAGEYDIIEEGYITLLTEVESCLVEVNDHREEILRIFDDTGFTIDNCYNTINNHSRHRRQNEKGNTAENIIFTRKQKRSRKNNG